MSWRLAKSLDVLRAQVNTHWPARKKDSDGTIGDAAHASRNSDHNPWVKDGAIGVVTALDITNDPERGPTSELLAEAIRRSHDARVKYIISNRKMASSYDAHGVPAWEWRHYSGSNPHDHHCHISVRAEKEKYDDVTPWAIETPTTGA